MLKPLELRNLVIHSEHYKSKAWRVQGYASCLSPPWTWVLFLALAGGSVEAATCQGWWSSLEFQVYFTTPAPKPSRASQQNVCQDTVIIIWSEKLINDFFLKPLPF